MALLCMLFVFEFCDATPSSDGSHLVGSHQYLRFLHFNPKAKI